MTEGEEAAAGVCGRGTAIWAEQVAGAAGRRPGPCRSALQQWLREWMLIHTQRIRAGSAGGPSGIVTGRTGVARPGRPMKRTDSGPCCRHCDCSCCCRASRWAHRAPSWCREAARTLQPSRQSPGPERRHPEARSWAAAAEEEEASAAAEPWMR